MEEAFDKLLKHVGFEPVWSQAPSAVLELKPTFTGKVPIPPPTAHDTPSDPKFSSVIGWGMNGEAFAREAIMARVLNHGLHGWRGQIRYHYNMDRQTAENRRRHPELFPPGGK